MLNISGISWSVLHINRGTLSLSSIKTSFFGMLLVFLIWKCFFHSTLTEMNISKILTDHCVQWLPCLNYGIRVLSWSTTFYFLHNLISDDLEFHLFIFVVDQISLLCLMFTGLLNNSSLLLRPKIPQTLKDSIWDVLFLFCFFIRTDNSLLSNPFMFLSINR